MGPMGPPPPIAMSPMGGVPGGTGANWGGLSAPSFKPFARCVRHVDVMADKSHSIGKSSPDLVCIAAAIWFMGLATNIYLPQCRSALA